MPKQAKIYYISLPDEMLKADKLTWLRETKFKDISFERITPDAKHNWINLSDNDFDSLLPLIDKDVKAGKSEQAVLKMFSSGLKTQRDDWTYDFDKDNLERKMRYFVDVYERTRIDEHFYDKMTIKWDADLDTYRNRNIKKEFEPHKMLPAYYRPYTKQWLYFDKHFNGRTYKWFEIYLDDGLNNYITISGIGSSKQFQTFVTDKLVCLDFLEKTQCLPFYYKNTDNELIENITDWALQKFQANYQDSQITKQDIFHYVYAVLHNPNYRQKYELNLKREFPRIPFYDDFNQWATWGKALMDLHINYESQTPFALITNEKLRITNKENSDDNEFVFALKTKLKADKINNTIEIDSITTLEGIPPIAWEYKLGNRSALEWILDQYKERKPQDATIAEKFNTYKFADYKESVINLLQKVCTVSVETQNIIEKMQKIR